MVQCRPRSSANLRFTPLSRRQHRFESGRGRQFSRSEAERLISAVTLGFSSLRWYRAGVQSVSAMTYLWRPKSGVYYFRRAVPHDLRPILGKTMVKRSLRTDKVAEAKRLAHPIAMQTEAEFQAARERLSAPPRKELSEAERAHLVAAYLHHR